MPFRHTNAEVVVGFEPNRCHRLKAKVTQSAHDIPEQMVGTQLGLLSISALPYCQLPHQYDTHEVGGFQFRGWPPSPAKAKGISVKGFWAES